MQRYSNQQLQARQEKTLDLARNILNGNAQISVLEMSLNIRNTFDSTNIKSIFKGENSTIAFGVMNVLVKRFMDSFGFSTKLSESQIETITVDALEHFSYETMEDAILFFKMARQGKFGATNRGVDSNLIFGGWLPLYLAQKADLREQNYVRDKNEQNKITVDLNDVKKTYDKLKGNGMRDRVIAYIEKITKDIDRNTLEKIITEWRADPIKNEYIQLLTLKRLQIKGDYKFDN